MAPSKPSNVKVSELQTVLETLQRIQSDVNSPPPETFEVIEASTLEMNLKPGDGSGLQGEGAHKASLRYHDNSHYFTQGWGDVKSGIGALVTMLQTTIAQHTATDSNVAQGANSTNTATTSPTSGSSAYGEN